ncbi:hypothetical protein FNV43_RR08092 [Rhamnella rubrinervis]|uniref:(S)-2-hydroxy-acid oxidase n=1 Tax=Rhamnella rubrinervis TaxID=2594499 RepID=A0A8K0HFW8_9ROSA|nr:hypothetical protein FNV43_RR08092 [Rhamnella rubrinervis]
MRTCYLRGVGSRSTFVAAKVFDFTSSSSADRGLCRGPYKAIGQLSSWLGSRDLITALVIAELQYLTTKWTEIIFRSRGAACCVELSCSGLSEWTDWKCLDGLDNVAGGIAQIANRGNAVLLDTPIEAGQDASKELVPMQGIPNKSVPMQENNKQPSFASIVSGGANTAWVKNFNPTMQKIMHAQIISDLAREIEVPLKINSATLSGNFGHFARALIDVDLAGFIPETLLLKTEDSCIEVQLDYERFPDFCNNCRNIGHSVDRCNMVHRQAPQVTDLAQIPPSTVVDTGIAVSNSKADHAVQDNIKGKSVQIPLDKGVDLSGMQVQDQYGSTSGGQINMDTTMELYDPVMALGAAQQNLDLVVLEHSVSETKDSNISAVLPTMWVFTSRSLEDVRILLSEEQIISVDILRVGVIGDFNVILGAHERSSGGPPIHSSCTDFQVAVEAVGYVLNKDFKSFVQSMWVQEVPGSPFHRVIAKLKKVKNALWDWNMDVFSDIHEKITLAQEKLLLVQNINGTEVLSEISGEQLVYRDDARFSKTMLESMLQGADSVDKFRPIILGNFLFKVVSKILADRLARTASRIRDLSEFESVFLMLCATMVVYQGYPLLSYFMTLKTNMIRILVGDLVDSYGVWNLPQSLRATFPQLNMCIEDVEIAMDRPDERVWFHLVSGTISCRDFYLHLSTMVSPPVISLDASGLVISIFEKAMEASLSTQVFNLWTTAIVSALSAICGYFVTSRGFIKDSFVVHLNSCYVFESELLGAITTIEYARGFREGNIVADTLSKIAVSSPGAQWPKNRRGVCSTLIGEMASEPVNVNEFQELAKQVIPKMFYDFYSGGAEDQYTLRENMEAFKRITLQPRIFVDVSKIDMSTTVLGYRISAPIMLAPTSMHQFAHPEGEVATARGAAASNTIMVLSYGSTCTIEEVASSCNAVRFFQLYVYKRRDITAQLVQRAEKSGFKALVLTVDVPRLGRREADIKNKMVAPQLRNLEGLISTTLDSGDGSRLTTYIKETMDASFCWEDIGWLRSITSLPILIKGVLTHEDARMAVEAGIDGIVVSNHGARQLDYTPATISVLEEVVHAVGGKVPVLFDGGVRRGTDVFKALALGAKAVLIGRPIIYGLAAMGEYGVRRVLEMLKDELELTMALSGCPREMASEPVNVNEFQELAKQVIPKMFYDFYSGGAEDQYTLKENMESFKRITLRPRILVDVSKIDMSTTVLGYKISAPIMLAPTAMHQFAHPDGEVATARGAAACNTIMVLSYMSTCTIEEVAASCNAVRFFQLYVYKRRDVTAQLVRRAEKCGFKALVLTVDVPRLGRREADIKNKLVAPQLRNFEGLLSTRVDSDDGSMLETYAKEIMDASFCWKDIGWLRSITSLPILIKGLLTHEDARMAVEEGVDGIIVSNHGARQLDYSPATISVLEEVVHAVGGKVPVLFDGGVRRGTDVFKALALGAKAVLVGRPIIYGLAAMGEYGVRRVLEMLKDELELAMALSGCPSVQHITRGHVRTEHEKLHSML